MISILAIRGNKWWKTRYSDYKFRICGKKNLTKLKVANDGIIRSCDNHRNCLIYLSISDIDMVVNLSL